MPTHRPPNPDDFDLQSQEALRDLRTISDRTWFPYDDPEQPLPPPSPFLTERIRAHIQRLRQERERRALIDTHPVTENPVPTAPPTAPATPEPLTVQAANGPGAISWDGSPLTVTRWCTAPHIDQYTSLTFLRSLDDATLYQLWRHSSRPALTRLDPISPGDLFWWRHDLRTVCAERRIRFSSTQTGPVEAAATHRSTNDNNSLGPLPLLSYLVHRDGPTVPLNPPAAPTTPDESEPAAPTRRRSRRTNTPPDDWTPPADWTDLSTQTPEQLTALAGTLHPLFGGTNSDHAPPLITALTRPNTVLPGSVRALMTALADFINQDPLQPCFVQPTRANATTFLTSVNAYRSISTQLQNHLLSNDAHISSYHTAITNWLRTVPIHLTATVRDLTDELNALARAPRNLKFYHHFNGSAHSIICVTPPIQIRDPHYHDTHPLELGPFSISMEINRSLLLGRTSPPDWFIVNALRPNREPLGSVHPHLSGQHLCLGNASPIIAAALPDLRIGDIFGQVYSVLRTYNHLSPYRRIANWDLPDIAEPESESDTDSPIFVRPLPPVVQATPFHPSYHTLSWNGLPPPATAPINSVPTQDPPALPPLRPHPTNPNQYLTSFTDISIKIETGGPNVGSYWIHDNRHPTRFSHLITDGTGTYDWSHRTNQTAYFPTPEAAHTALLNFARTNPTLFNAPITPTAPAAPIAPPAPPPPAVPADWNAAIRSVRIVQPNIQQPPRNTAPLQVGVIRAPHQQTRPLSPLSV